MRTTVEITDEQRGKLLHEAARLGEKGFSAIVREALDLYFEAESDRRVTLERALQSIGSLGGREANRLENDIRSLRRSWR